MTSEAQLDQLELQVSHLMHLASALRSENIVLRQKMAESVKDRARLQYRNQRAARQVKQIVKQLKEGLA
ncbi:MAG: hypothetical protein A3I77_04725 [Gammaproteobacteria bacterium RIFCSPLOWO2_02_FULL_42_14]|nr:MAG: hypothetical protein A3B71_06025 [Gammaproteobacteria bacterium RIFCSPHIGHO2_02_FULL_42_43]OGT28972.1 MAG: hypothetical protein A2624_02970 [Gammaproteobacteria bacterium RIFCSPHIGHO2_01_FULL_42_8]OGT51620.1 MAG: hypothetical protein A3E54_05790 [Gammaproteobacteria bacterium RIFCSPHIGHO2_12_FULL_41_25]OGT62320.1 MAG: hypothetical protein A3I77_04725 [Gammaproteobacteria bacterium RIFCSPLOWO2_02_FULL_42_14]OGT85994.1 MAG: hypothetical protein A3G86_04415 [Gammaproteobacteria bacterium R